MIKSTLPQCICSLRLMISMNILPDHSAKYTPCRVAQQSPLFEVVVDQLTLVIRQEPQCHELQDEKGYQSSPDVEGQGLDQGQVVYESSGFGGAEQVVVVVESASGI